MTAAEAAILLGYAALPGRTARVIVNPSVVGVVREADAVRLRSDTDGPRIEIGCHPSVPPGRARISHRRPYPQEESRPALAVVR